MTSSTGLHGLYVITDPVLCQNNLLQQVEQALLGGAEVVQYRNKQADDNQKHQQAKALATLCRDYQRLLIINDDIELALEVDADGVHIGQHDAPLVQARQRLGRGKLIGVSCNNQLAWALTAQQQGADYVAFGRFFPSRTKPQAPQADLALLHQAREQLTIPIVAIGGIQQDNARQLVDAGADMVAMIHAIFGQADIRSTAQQVARLFTG